MTHAVSNSFDFRPRPGVTVVVMFLSREGVRMVDGVVLFDRGRGIIVAADGAPADDIKCGGTAMIAFDKAGVMQCLTCTVDEVFTDRKFYLIPRGEVRHLEAREYLREVTTLPFAVGPVGEVPSRTSGAIELSGSGFRFLAGASFAPSARLQLSIEPLPGVVLDLAGTVLRCTARDARYEIAGRFDDMDAAARDMILDAVFKARFRSLGLVDS